MTKDDLMFILVISFLIVSVGIALVYFFGGLGFFTYFCFLLAICAAGGAGEDTYD